MLQSTPSQRQRAYYARTARDYDDMHTFDEHRMALWHVAAFVRQLGARTLLDTGCGTGLAMRLLGAAVPELEIRGNDPSPALLDVAAERHGIPRDRLDVADSTALPYDDGAFDVVVETAMLHHVPDPEPVIAEMLRVARQAVFLSDSNLYGLGHPLARLVKLGLARVGLLERVNRARRGGHDWYYTDGDGVAWSYSVFDSLPQLRLACADVLVIPTMAGGRGATAFPLLCSEVVLAAAFKEPLRPDALAR